MGVDGRSICAYDLVYMTHGFSLAAWISVECPGLVKNPKKLKAAFDQVVQTTPILQSQVIVKKTDENDDAPSTDEASKYRYVLKKARGDWPSLDVRTAPDEKVQLEMAQKYVREKGSIASLSDPVHMCAILGPRDLCLALAAPHFFCDGVALQTIFGKFLIYSKTPKVMWRMIDRLSPKETPNAIEMALKSDLPAIKKLDYDLIGKTDSAGSPNNFCFSSYDFMAPGAADDFLAFKKVICNAPHESVKLCLQELRKLGVTFSTIVMALSVKILAILLDEHKLNPNNHPLVVNVAVDGQKCGKWGKGRHNKYRSNKVSFPVVGNFVFSVAVQLSMEGVLQTDLVATAMDIKTCLNKVLSDPIERASRVVQCSGLPTSGMRCGASSILESSTQGRLRKMAGANVTSFESGIAFGPVPHVWFYIISLRGSPTPLTLDFMLPIHGLTESDVLKALARACQGSPLEKLLNAQKSLKTEQ